jgi:hypothetical protein
VSWICKPCKNNRHDLCLKDSTSRTGTNVKLRCWLITIALRAVLIDHLRQTSPKMLIQIILAKNKACDRFHLPVV